MKKSVPNYTLWYILLGLVFGMVFVVIGTLIAVPAQGLAFTLENLVLVHLITPLLWLIDTFPFVIAAVMGIAGSRERRLAVSRIQERSAMRLATDLQQRAADLARREEERQELDVVIERAKKEWEATFDSVDDLILLTDEAGTVTRVNRAAAMAFHTSFQQVIGKDVHRLFFGGASAEQERMPLQKTEIKFPTLDGWYQVASSPVVSEGRELGTIYVVRNISAYKQAMLDVQRQKQFYESLVNNSPFAIVTLNMDERIVSANPAFEKMFGYRQQDVMGQDLDNMIAPYDMMEETRSITEQVRQGEIVRSLTRRRCMDGSLIDVEVYGIPVILWGKQIGILGLYHDVSEFVRPQTAEAVEVVEWLPEEELLDEEVVEAEVIETEVESQEEEAKPDVRSYKVASIEGIGPVFSKALSDAGIFTTEDLLNAASDRKGRSELAEKTGISPKLILKWANHADLMRVPGVGEEYSDLLEASGVDTVKELRNRNPENLHTALLTTNEEKKLVRRPPHLSEVEAWVQAAKAIPPRMTY